MSSEFLDLFVALGGVVPQLIWEITVVFYAPTAICKLYKYISSAVTYASSFALVVLSVDRAEAVCRPLRVASSGLSSKTRARLLIGAAWVAAALFGLPGPLLAHKDYEGTEREACLLNFTKISPQVYLTSIAVSVFVLPACIIATCHVIMVATIWRASKLQTATFDGCPSHPVTLTRQTSNDVHLVQLEVTRKPRLAMPRYNRHKRSSTEGFLQKPKQPTHQNAGCIPRAKVKTVKMTCVIVSAYIICWCPFMVWNMLVTYGVMKRSAPQLMKYTPIVQHLVPLNSAANPIIFWIFNASTIRKSMHQPVRGPITQRTRLNT
ncbi:hypothetical protein EG68_00211 [Paragonimus skrjabini miyazakii]|uniref:G-protein coupled receptors family 1 profile domain-containing protein n=1 Tax=Paragonimus skrjabini miyazakii TaxID=59628 RepID=A0A8S9Z9L9_9TREM|nr:hypothetical protein EG68_00211 [Paragonimus skrjabini miyazakii]